VVRKENTFLDLYSVFNRALELPGLAAVRGGGKLGALVDVRFLLEPDALTISIRDRGEGFEPTVLLDPLEPENLLKPTFWIRTFMDEVEYSAHPEGGCVVRMKKYTNLSRKPI
jgi:anti-sigma regulatory factor (Ser/Thr protein kinase)